MTERTATGDELGHVSAPLLTGKPTGAATSTGRAASPPAPPLEGRGGDRIAADVQGVARNDLEALREASRRLKLYARHASQDTRDRIQRKPLTSVMVAAALGALAMAAISLALRR